MNSSTFSVKIVSIPQERLIANEISVLEMTVQFAKLRKKRSFDKFQIALWGNLGKEFTKYYKVGDYIIIKGMLSFKKTEIKSRIQKDIKMTVIKLYPFLLPD